MSSVFFVTLALDFSTGVQGFTFDFGILTLFSLIRFYVFQSQNLLGMEYPQVKRGNCATLGETGSQEHCSLTHLNHEAPGQR